MPSQFPSFRIALRVLIAASSLLLVLIAALQFFPGLPSPFRSTGRVQAQESTRKSRTIAPNPPDLTTPANDDIESAFSGSVVSDAEDFVPVPPPPLLGQFDSESKKTGTNPAFDSELEPVPLPPIDDFPPDAPAPMLGELRRLDDRIGELERRIDSTRAAQAELGSSEAAKLAELLQQLQDQSSDMQAAAERIDRLEQRPALVQHPVAVSKPQPVAATRISIRSVEEGGESRWVIQARDASLPELLARLGEATGMNLLVAPEVAGTVSLHLIEPDADAALEAVCRLHRCRPQRDGNFVVIVPDSDAAYETKSALPDLISKLYRLKHLSGAEIRPYVQPLLTPGLGTFGFASIRERVARTTYRHPPRAFLVKDTARVIAEIDRLVVELDRPPKSGLELPPPGEPLPERVATQPASVRPSVPTSPLRLEELFEPPVTSENPIYSQE